MKIQVKLQLFLIFTLNSSDLQENFMIVNYKWMEYYATKYKYIDKWINN